MYTKRQYKFWVTFRWSQRPFWLGALYAVLVTALYVVVKHYSGMMLVLPWNPIGIVGISVAFYLGFKNNASYDRSWEARKIWGGIVNNSRSFGVAIISFAQGEDAREIHRRILHRHIGWLTALRYQLRLRREWEHEEDRIKGMFYPETTDKYFKNLDRELCALLDKKEASFALKKSNTATQLLLDQSRDLQHLRDQGYFDDFRHMELHKLVTTFYDDQGRSERIKNFPFPRQYASAGYWQTIIFSLLIPFGLLDVLGDSGYWKVWMNVPITALIIWVFFLTEKIGDYSENPFEGSYNDVPITSIARAIEIDLREMLNEEHVPPAYTSDNGFLM